MDGNFEILPYLGAGPLRLGMSRKQAEADGSPLEIVGIIVFLNSGISMTGFLQDDEPGQKAFGVFAKGRFDTKLEKMHPFKLKNK
jgi:hypothetical protein